MNDPLQSKKHVCIFEMERKGGKFTGEVVCIVCGIKLLPHQASVKREVFESTAYLIDRQQWRRKVMTHSLGKTDSAAAL